MLRLLKKRRELSLSMLHTLSSTVEAAVVEILGPALGIGIVLLAAFAGTSSFDSGANGSGN